jgi:hypothetical protein
MQKLRDSFSIGPSELEEARAMLQSMVKDMAHSFQKRGMMQQQRQPGAQGQAPQMAAQNQLSPQSQEQIAQQQRLMAQKQQQQQQQQQQQLQLQQGQMNQQGRQPQQQQQQQQSAPAPLNAANLEKNSQAFKNQQRAAGKGFKAPAAPTATQPPFPLGASSPHGNPSYIGKPKELNLQLPPRKRAKLDKQAGQTSQAATPSPKVATKPTPPQDTQRPPEPPKPVLVCKEPECQDATVGYADEEVLRQHVEEEHVKPKKDPLKFFAEDLALALGLEADGSSKKTTAMSRTASKQGQTPGNLGIATPKSQHGAGMNRSISSQSKIAGTKSAPASPDAWAGSTLDSQALFTMAGFPNGISTVAFDPKVLSYLSPPKDTPESSKDSGASEPNSDMLDLVPRDFDVNWQVLDMDMLLDMNKTKFKADLLDFGGDKAGTMDPSLLMNTKSPGEPDWSDVKIDFNAPYKWDARGFSMDVK